MNGDIDEQLKDAYARLSSAEAGATHLIEAEIAELEYQLSEQQRQQEPDPHRGY